MQYPVAPPNSSLGVLFATLQAAGVEYAGALSNGGRFTCPVHPDSNPSFDVTLGRNGKAVFRCSPCAAQFGQEEFWKALRARGVGWKGNPCTAEEVEWGERAPSFSKGGAKGEAGHVEMKLAKVHYYRFEDGTANFRVRRMEETPESFTARVERAKATGIEPPGKRRKDPMPQRFNPRTRKWTWGLRPTEEMAEPAERTPYGLEHFEGWRGLPLVVVEGEVKAEALWAAGTPATSFAGGADAPVPSDWPTRYGFDRFRAVWFWADRDGAGVRLMERLAKDAENAGIRVGGVYVAPESYGPGSDASDVLAAGGSVLRKALVPASEFVPPAVDLTAPATPEAGGAASSPVSGPGERSRAPVDRFSKPLVSAGDWEGGAVGTVPQSSGPAPYPVLLSADPRGVAVELLGRHFGGRFARLRYFGAERFGVWDDTEGHFARLDAEEAEVELDELLDGAWEVTADGPRPMTVKPNNLRDVLRSLENVTAVKKKGPRALKSLRGKVPFKNGVLDIEHRTIEKAGPEWDLWWCLPFDWTGTPERCTEWIKFLDSLGFGRGTEEHRFLQQVFGYILAGRGNLHKIILFLGPKRAGKGTILHVLDELLGDGSVPLTLDSFEQNFGLQDAIGAGLVTIGDARFERNPPKKLIERLLMLSGGDTLPVDQKFRSVKKVNFQLGGRFIIGTNEPPSFVEASDALASRFAILRFTKSFYDKEDLELQGKLSKELPGIVRWALKGLEDLDANGGRFAEPTSGIEVRKQIERDSNTLRSFVEDKCALGQYEKVANEELFLAYTRWAEMNNVKYTLSSVHFARDLKTTFPDVTDGWIGKKKAKHGIGLVHE